MLSFMGATEVDTVSEIRTSFVTATETLTE